MNQTGRATIAGFAGTVSYTGSATLFKKSGNFKVTTKLTELRDEQDILRGHVGPTPEHEFSMTFTPVAASGTNTLANAKTSLAAGPATQAAVTLADFDDSTLNHARWVYMGDWAVTYDSAGLASCSLTIKCSADSSINLSTPIS